MKIFLSNEAFDALLKVSKEIGVSQSELVSQLVIEFARTAPEDREIAEHVCPQCSLRFFSSENLGHHEKKHSKIVVEK